MAFCGKYKLSAILVHRCKSLKIRRCLPGNLPVDVLYGVLPKSVKSQRMNYKVWLENLTSLAVLDEVSYSLNRTSFKL